VIVKQLRLSRTESKIKFGDGRALSVAATAHKISCLLNWNPRVQVIQITHLWPHVVQSAVPSGRVPLHFYCGKLGYGVLAVTCSSVSSHFSVRTDHFLTGRWSDGYCRCSAAW